MNIKQDISALTPSHAQQRWDERYQNGPKVGHGQINEWILAQQRHLHGGRALDFACGVGRHSLWLAERGYMVDAVDISMAGLQRLAGRAKQQGLSHAIHLIHADLTQWRPEKATYDLVFVTRYLDRSAFPALSGAVRPGGLLLYQSFHTDLLRLRDFDPNYVLQPGELLQSFAGLEILAYEERRLQPGSTDRRACMSSLLARRPEL
jgi:2-polyprenyl-3-methyl-5-hydroxy-6-metoxy-1,4-benzoquinol methylase